MAKFGKDLIYKTKVIVRKPVDARPPAISNHAIWSEMFKTVGPVGPRWLILTRSGYLLITGGPDV